MNLSAKTQITVLLLLQSAVGIHAFSLDDIQLWTGSGTNRAALVIHWSAPEVRNNSFLMPPITEKSMAWGFRWNGSANGETMFNAIIAADPRLFATVSATTPQGKALFGLGYDLNHNSRFGAAAGTNLVAAQQFTNGLAALSYDGADGFQSLDGGDLYWAGWYGPNWELWRELGEAGGFLNAPDRGPNPFWDSAGTTNTTKGTHGQWHLSNSGMSGSILHDGSWLGWTVAAGGLEFSNPNSPGTLALQNHKHAPSPPEAAAAPYSMNAVQLVAAQGPFGAAPYDDPTSVLGAPATDFSDPFVGAGDGELRKAKLTEPTYEFAPDGKTKLITTLRSTASGGSSYIIAAFDHPIYDNPANPYGIDFLVFGNSFFVSPGSTDDGTDMNQLLLSGGGFYESVKVSVSPGFTGKPGENATNSATWPWYRYDKGPYADSEFPTQGYHWDRTNSRWTTDRMDFTKPVNPVLKGFLDSGDTHVLSAADAMDLYDGSGGGTGFDLKESGFSSVRYIKVEGISPDFSDGEIDAFSTVRPLSIGDEFVITPDNLTNGTGKVFFQQPGRDNQNLATIDFKSLGGMAKVSIAPAIDVAISNVLSSRILAALQINVASALGTGIISHAANLSIATPNYSGDGSDLQVAQVASGTTLFPLFAFDPTNRLVRISDATHLSTFVVSQITGPSISLDTTGPIWRARFNSTAGWIYALERSTNLTTWISVASITPTNNAPAFLQDSGRPSQGAFYRLHLTQ